MLKLFRAIKQSASEFVADGCMSSGAAIAYYSIFALPPLVLIVFLIVNYAGISQERINESLKARLGIPTLAGQTASGSKNNQNNPTTNNTGQLGSSFGAIAKRTESQNSGIGTLSGIVGVIILLFTATGLFSELQYALNRAWDVKPDPNQGGIKRFFVKRLLSLGLIALMVVLLLASMIVSTLINEIYSYVRGVVPSALSQVVSFTIDNLITITVATVLFAAVFKFLPDAKMRWRDLWIGAAATALLFVIGKALIAWYLRNANLGASWGGAAGSLIAVLAWFYYTSLILLYGAELTQVWTREFGQGFQPAAGAVSASGQVPGSK